MSLTLPPERRTPVKVTRGELAFDGFEKLTEGGTSDARGAAEVAVVEERFEGPVSDEQIEGRQLTVEPSIYRRRILRQHPPEGGP
jgi:hypothetical protein